jgi:hypothetical protein
MRLETPVLYFHPPQAGATSKKISVKATFHGGWLTEFYPNALADVPGVDIRKPVFGRLNANTVSSLDWENLEVGGDWQGPPTDSHVWSAPRAVASAPVRSANGETERFLFYRGVGRIDAPLRVARDDRTRELVLESQLAKGICGEAGLAVRSLWLVDIQPDGKLAFRDIPPVTLAGSGKILARVSSEFSPGDYRAGNLEKLKGSLRTSLMAEGLFKDEADALLNTWEYSYFKCAGTRVFFMVPRAWTDSCLPLAVSEPADFKRAMVGRIELVTPEARGILRELARTPKEQILAEFNVLGGRLNRSHPHTMPETLAHAGVTVPDSYKLYLQLGRFKNALLLDEAARRPSPGLTAFVGCYGLGGYKPVASTDNAFPRDEQDRVVTSAVP